MYGTMLCSCRVRVGVDDGCGRHMHEPSPLAIFGRNVLSCTAIRHINEAFLIDHCPVLYCTAVRHFNGAFLIDYATGIHRPLRYKGVSSCC